MRPVERPAYTGPAVTHYQAYLQPLIEAFGTYCSYCERLDKFDVEHVAPKSLNPALATTWSNMLLGCPRCNRDFKRSNNNSRLTYVWPDTHNTYKLLKYWPDGRVQPASGLDEDIHKYVVNTINLVCLDDSAQPQNHLNLARRAAFNVAEIFLAHYENKTMSIDDVLTGATQGHWSVWFTVFQAHPQVLVALETLHPNTAIHRPY